MSRESIIEKLESIEGVDVSDIIQDVENVFNDMEDLRHDLRRANDNLDDKKKEIEVLEETVEEVENKSPIDFEKQMHNNLRTQSVLEDLLANIDYIPIDQLEEFVAKHRKL